MGGANGPGFALEKNPFGSSLRNPSATRINNLDRGAKDPLGGSELRNRKEAAPIIFRLPRTLPAGTTIYPKGAINFIGQKINKT